MDIRRSTVRPTLSRTIESMRSIVYSSTGTSDVLRLVERAIPEPGPGQVRVRMLVSGVNPTDWKRRVISGL